MHTYTLIDVHIYVHFLGLTRMPFQTLSVSARSPRTL